MKWVIHKEINQDVMASLWKTLYVTDVFQMIVNHKKTLPENIKFLKTDIVKF